MAVAGAMLGLGLGPMNTARADTGGKNLGDEIQSQTDSRIAAVQTVTPTTLAMFSEADDVHGKYVRNPQVWTTGIDLSGIGVHSDTSAGYGGSKQCGVLITPADIAVANHFRFNVGDKCTFVDNQNVTYYATIIALSNVAGDLTVEHLTWEKKVPALKVMPILPPDFRRYWPYHEPGSFPIICTNQFRQVFVQDAALTAFPENFFFHMPAQEPRRLPFTLPIIVGDSSQPVMVIIGGAPVLITCNTTAVSGVSYPDTFAAINQALATMGSRWRATAADLQGFKTY